MRRECRHCFPRHWFKKTLVSDPGMHHGTCVTNVPWYMQGSLNRGGGENVAGILGACATRYFMYLARGSLRGHLSFQFNRVNWKSTDNCGLDNAMFGPDDLGFVSATLLSLIYFTCYIKIVHHQSDFGIVLTLYAILVCFVWQCFFYYHTLKYYGAYSKFISSTNSGDV